MSVPLQVAPINRAEIIPPYGAVDLNRGSLLARVQIRLDLLHGANFNDPQPFRVMSYAQAKLTS